ncbi:hypothetical protein D3C77_338070 [compost metagenome]
MLDSSEQHTSRPTGWIVDGVDLFRIEHVDHQPHHAAGGIELTGLLVSSVGKFLDQVFVGVAQKI